MRIALISHSPDLHGAECSLLDFAGLFSKEEDIELIIPYPEGDMVKVANDKEYNYVLAPPNPWYIYQSPNNTGQFQIYCEEVKKQYELYQDILENVDPDVVIVNTLTNFIPHLAAFFLKIPVISWIHGVLDPEIIPGIDPQYQSFIDQSILKLSRYILFNSKWTEKKFCEEIESEDYLTISNWTLEPKNYTHYNPFSKRFICLNSMEVKKGNSILVEASKIVHDKGYHFYVDLFGTGIEKDKIIGQIQKFQLNDYVRVFSPTTDTTSLYNDCIALIQPSLYESFGRTIIEAMAHKRPVIATRSADPEGIIEDGENGVCIEPGNSFALAEKMINVLENPEQWRKMGEKGHQTFLNQFNGDHAKKLIKNLLKEIHKIKRDKSQEEVFKQLMKTHGIIM